MNLLKKVVFLLLFSVIFFGGIHSLEAQSSYFVREGWISRNAHANNLNIGEFSSPHNLILPYLEEDDRGFLTLTEVERYLRNYGFENSQVNRVRDLLRTGGGHAFLYYVNRDDFYRWIWITPYQ